MDVLLSTGRHYVMPPSFRGARQMATEGKNTAAISKNGEIGALRKHDDMVVLLLRLS